MTIPACTGRQVHCIIWNIPPDRFVLLLYGWSMVRLKLPRMYHMSQPSKYAYSAQIYPCKCAYYICTICHFLASMHNVHKCVILCAHISWCVLNFSPSHLSVGARNVGKGNRGDGGGGSGSCHSLLLGLMPQNKSRGILSCHYFHYEDCNLSTQKNGVFFWMSRHMSWQKRGVT